MSNLIKVYTVLHEQPDQGLHCLPVQTHYSVVKPHCSISRIITAILSGVGFFSGFYITLNVAATLVKLAIPPPMIKIFPGKIKQHQ